MIENKNNRLNLIFTLWFLAVALIPLIAVTTFFAYAQTSTIQDSTDRELAFVTRVTTDRFNTWAIQRLTLLHLIADTFPASGPLAGEASRLVSGGASAAALRLTLLTRAGQVVATAAEKPIPGDFLPDKPQPTFSITAEGVRFAIPVRNGAYWLLAQESSNALSQVIHSDVNDTRFFSKLNLLGSNSDVGSTADIFIADGTGKYLSDALMNDVTVGATVASNELQQWLQQDHNNEWRSRITLAGRDVFVHARRMQTFGTTAVFVASIDRSEVLRRLNESRRNSLIVYLLIMALVLVLLYFFVGNLGRYVINPIYGSIRDLILSSTRIKQGIATSEAVMRSEESVSTELLRNYRGTVKDINRVNAEISAMVEALLKINKQTTTVSQNGEVLNALATQGQQQAREAEVSLQVIRRMATANEALTTSLDQYRSAIASIAADMHRLSQSIQFLSLNASIEAANADQGHSMVETLVAEVGRLSLLSSESSSHISDLAGRMQTDVAKTREASQGERRAADRSLVVTNDALAALHKMSREIAKITQSVRVINSLVADESTSTTAIAAHSHDVTERAQASLKESSKITALIAKQKENVLSNLGAARQMIGTINKLSTIIGSSDDYQGKKK